MNDNIYIYFGREVVFKENSVIGLKDCSVFTGVKNVLQHNPLVANGSTLWHFLHAEGTFSILVDDLVNDLVPSPLLEMLLIQNL